MTHRLRPGDLVAAEAADGRDVVGLVVAAYFSGGNPGRVTYTVLWGRYGLRVARGYSHWIQRIQQIQRIN